MSELKSTLPPLAQSLVDAFGLEKMAWRRDARKDIVGSFDIDTCNVFNDGWETAIAFGNDGDMIPVEEYADKDAAYAGHDRWKERCKNMTEAELMALKL